MRARVSTNVRLELVASRFCSSAEEMIVWKLSFIGLAGVLIVFGSAAVEAAPAFPPGVEARDARLNARLKPQARAWLKKEAARARASNRVSEAELSQAVRSAGPGLDLAGMSVEDAVLIMMMSISRDAREDVRDMLVDMKQARSKEKATRETVNKQSAAKTPANSQFRKELPAQRASPRIPRSPALDDFLASQRVSYDSLGDLSQDKQRKMQMALDHMAKADAAASTVLKKSSSTESGIVRNIK